MVNFKAPYNKEEAVSFLGQFLPDDFQKANEEIKLDFKPQFIRHIRKIGEVSSLENLHIYEIIHESENDPRVSLSKDSFRLLAHFNVRKALIFFVSQNSPNYRLSLVTVDLKWESGAKVKREYSNPRRYSFFLGPDARVHTPHDFLVKKGQAKNTTDLLSRFDVEIVTKEFFTKYKGLFGDVSGYLEKDHGFKIFAEKNDIDIDTFSKKLLGQIVFCYFLQRKGWLGARRGEPINKGDKDFMRSLFIRGIAEKKNFYNDYLEYLFYDSLNNRAEGSSDFYRKHFDCQIPFLNGGLFEPPEDYDWEKSFVHIPDKIFSNKENTGILDVFDLYNFTVYEDDPIDREVSVDPEMLGKVFENLLPENLRKGQGAYYTPREIVHYMCQESLINYLITETKIDVAKIRDLVINKHFEGEGNKESIDRALKNIKVCDPACGSGAFLVGMLHEIVSARRILNPKADEYHLKKEVIQNCVYGVDIDPGAVEIAKLRLWLSLVVDYELKDIEPLPNLDYKIMCGNSLLEEFEGVRFYDGGTDEASLFKDDRKQKIQELREKVKEYFKVYDDKEKRKKREEINKLKDWFIKATLEKRRKAITRERKKIEAKADMFQEKNRQEYFTAQGEIFISEAKINEVLRELHNPQKPRPFFIWKLEFMDVFEDKGGFDVVIANPPYIRISGISEQEDQAIRKNYSAVFGHYDMYIPFMEKSIILLNTKGVLAYITPNKYLTKRYANKLRPFILKETKIIELIDTSLARTFDSASVYPVITILAKEKVSNQIEIAIVDDSKFEIFFHSHQHSKQYSISQDEFSKNKNYIFDIFIDSENRSIFNKMLSNTKQLGSYSQILTGTPAINKFYEWHKLLFSEKEAPDIKHKLKFINVSNVKPYHISWGEEVRAAKKRVSKPYLVYDKKLVGPNKWAVFEQKKIVIKGNAKRLTAAYDDVGYANLSLYAIMFSSDHDNLDKTFFHLALLNSTLLNYWFCKKFATSNLAGNYISFNGIYLEQLPIKIIKSDNMEFLISLVRKILVITKDKEYLSDEKKQAKVKEYERQIDQMVYKLYGLTDEEIKIVENFNQQK